MNIAKSIRVGLALRDMSQQDVSEYVSKSIQTVSSWMNNKSDPKLSDLEKISELFNVPVSKFIEWGE